MGTRETVEVWGRDTGLFYRVFLPDSSFQRKADLGQPHVNVLSPQGCFMSPFTTLCQGLADVDQTGPLRQQCGPVTPSPVLASAPWTFQVVAC